ncbi:MAG: sulfopropanediol 3-dehydrogenase, partial [Mycobacterium sp.]|nr:sulfopropanediol 3-dehydrogenase [Mycobacterium sp.]
MEGSVPEYLKRAAAPLSMAAGDPDVAKVVSEVIADVRERGDVAVRQYSEKFDRWSPPDFRLSPDEIERIVDQVDPRVLDDIRTVQRNVRDFAGHQRDSLTDFEVEAQPGVFLGQRSIPVGSVGAYVPGGRYPLVASAHMTVATATVAGVENIIACTPPTRGEIPATTVAAMHLAGATDILLLGGVQAIAALAVGTETIAKVDLIAGPGNAYVAEAKRQLFGEIGIDLLAGPTEILIIADEHADPFVAAVDLISQAEHGPDSPAVLITTSGGVARRAQEHVEALLPGLPTRGFAEPAWRDHGQIIVVDTMTEAYELADDFAFEHVEVLTEHPREALEAMRNYGALFLG